MVDAAKFDDLVEEYKIGNTTIRIFNTAYKNRTQEEIDATKKRLTDIGWEVVREALSEGREI